MLRSALANTLASARRAAPRLRAVLCDALAAVPREEAAASARKVAELQAQLRGRDEELGQRLRRAELGAAQDVAQRDGAIAELRARLRTSVREFATLATAAQALCEALAAEDRIEGAVLRAYNVLRAALVVRP